MRTIVHVNQHNIRHNTKTGDDRPVFTVKTYKENRTMNEVVVRAPTGEEIRFVYSPDPLSCGARAWVEFDSADFEVV